MPEEIPTPFETHGEPPEGQFAVVTVATVKK